MTKVYRVAKKGDSYVMLMAERVLIKRSWWHVRHKDGTITRHNGGKGWHEHPIDAWFEAMHRSLFLLMGDGNSEQDEALQELYNILADAWQTSAELGKLLAQCEQLTESCNK